MSIRNRALKALSLVTLFGAAGARGQATAEVPMWAYPSPPPGFQHPADDGVARRVPGSQVTYTLTQLRDPFFAPDWHPQEHPPMPDAVRQGRRPDQLACGYCHRATGTGGPENASVAGLPRTYILRQLRDYQSGARRTAVPGRAPTALMISTVKAASDADLEAAADYFSKLKLAARIRVKEGSAAPKLTLSNWLFAAAPGGGTEPLGRRIVEVPENLEQFEARDPHARFVAYVPRGSVARGEQLVKTGGGKTLACAGCHEANLRGTAEIPPIAGRSPTYMVRQLVELQRGVRRGVDADQMEPVVSGLTLDDMIDLAAYLATQAP